MERSTLKNIFILLIIVAAGGIYYFLFYTPGKLQTENKLYRDEGNQISFEKPEGWVANSIEGYAKVAEDALDSNKPSVLIKMEYPESVIPALGLDVGEEVSVGGKTVRRVDHEWETKDSKGVVTGMQTFTFFLWRAPDGREIIFEISPWQKTAISEEVERVLRNFN